MEVTIREHKLACGHRKMRKNTQKINENPKNQKKSINLLKRHMNNILHLVVV